MEWQATSWDVSPCCPSGRVPEEEAAASCTTARQPLVPVAQPLPDPLPACLQDGLYQLSYDAGPSTYLIREGSSFEILSLASRCLDT
jgi:hypothetical protein